MSENGDAGDDDDDEGGDGGTSAKTDANAAAVDATMKQPMPSGPAAKTDAGAGPADDGAMGTDDAHTVAPDAGTVAQDTGAVASDTADACIPSAEVCDGQDNDCDGQADEEAPTWYCDADGDGFAASATSKITSCDRPQTGSRDGWTTTAPMGPEAQDCDDTTGLRFPGPGFGLTAGNGDLNCDGQIETKLELIESSIPGYYSSTTPFNVCEHSADDLIGGDTRECDYWYSTAIGKGFSGFKDGGAQFSGTGSSVGRGPYFMSTFPCAEERADAIFLYRIRTFGSACEQDQGLVAVRQLCR